MQALHAYIAQEPDEMDLMEGDIIQVHRKMNDGKHPQGKSDFWRSDLKMSEVVKPWTQDVWKG